MCKFTVTQIAAFRALGWEFLPTGPNGYDWLKFDKDGTRIATGGDHVWRKDVEAITGEAI